MIAWVAMTLVGSLGAYAALAGSRCCWRAARHAGRRTSPARSRPGVLAGAGVGGDRAADPRHRLPRRLHDVLDLDGRAHATSRSRSPPGSPLAWLGFAARVASSVAGAGGAARRGRAHPRPGTRSAVSRPQPSSLTGARELDALGLQLRHRRLDVVAHQVQLVRGRSSRPGARRARPAAARRSASRRPRRPSRSSSMSRRKARTASASCANMIAWTPVIMTAPGGRRWTRGCAACS